MLRLTAKARGFDECARALKRAPGHLRRELTRAFRDAARPTLRRVKTNIETMQIRGYRTPAKDRFTDDTAGGGIRRRISRVTEVDISTSAAGPRARFVVRTGRLGNARNVPFHLDSGKVFRHPIMGNRSRWAGSSGKPWFYGEIRKDLRIFEAECEQAINTTVRAIEG